MMIVNTIRIKTETIRCSMNLMKKRMGRTFAMKKAKKKIDPCLCLNKFLMEIKRI